MHRSGTEVGAPAADTGIVARFVRGNIYRFVGRTGPSTPPRLARHAAPWWFAQAFAGVTRDREGGVVDQTVALVDARLAADHKAAP
jgi:hypothetical protein